MPSVSAKQHRAMEAAAHGHSTLGIPKKVAKEYVDADEGRKTRSDKGSLRARHPASHDAFHKLGHPADGKY